MPTVAELTDELRRLGGSGYSGKKKAELEVMLADLKKFLASKKAPAPAPAAEAPKSKKVSAELRAKLHADKFLLKAYNTVGGIDMLIEDIDKVLSGEMEPLKGESRDYGRPVYDLGTFASEKWKNNANGVSTPEATAKLISQIPGGGFELLIMGTGDVEAYGRYEDVVMALLGPPYKKESEKKEPEKKAVEAAPAPLSAHAESMAKKAKPAKTGAISTPLSALSAGPAKRSLAEEKAELEAKIKKYEDKKKSAEKRLREIEAIIHAEDTKKAKEYAKKRDEEEAAENALKIDPKLNPIIERLNAIPINTHIYSLRLDLRDIGRAAGSIDEVRHDQQISEGYYSTFLGRSREKSSSELDEFYNEWGPLIDKIPRNNMLSKSRKEEFVKLLKRWRVVLIEPYGGD